MTDKPLTLIPITSRVRRQLDPASKLDLLEKEVAKALEIRLEILRDEAEVLKSDMEAALGRIKRYEKNADLRDIKTARWYRVATEVRCFQDVARYISSLRGTAVSGIPAPEDDET